MNEVVASWPALFAPCPPGTPHVTLKFRVVRRGGHPLLFLPAAGRAAATALDLYPAQSPKARAAKALLRLALRWGCGPLLATTSQMIPLADPYLGLLTRAAQGSPPAGPPFAVLAGNPHAPGRRFVFLLCGADASPMAVVKAGGSVTARRLIAHESRLLADCAGKFTGLPAVRATLVSDRVEAFALDFIRGESPRANSGPAVAALLETWIDRDRTVGLSELPAWQRLVSTTPTNPLPPAVQALGESRLRPVLMHGDFAPWNIKVSGNQWTVMDWERGERAGIPGWDWFHFVVQPAVLVQRDRPEKIMADLDALLASPGFIRYATATGMTGHERLLALAYVDYCRQVTRQTEGRELLNALAAAMRAQWV